MLLNKNRSPLNLISIKVDPHLSKAHQLALFYGDGHFFQGAHEREIDKCAFFGGVEIGACSSFAYLRDIWPRRFDVSTAYVKCGLYKMHARLTRLAIILRERRTGRSLPP